MRSGYKWLWSGLGAIVLGFILLAATESLTVAPLLIVGGYCVLIPAHLWSRFRKGVGE